MPQPQEFAFATCASWVMTFLENHGNFRIEWSAEDAEYVGLCAEFPSLSWLAATKGNALTGIRRLVGNVLADMRVEGEFPPEPHVDPTSTRGPAVESAA